MDSTVTSSRGPAKGNDFFVDPLKKTLSKIETMHISRRLEKSLPQKYRRSRFKIGRDEIKQNVVEAEIDRIYEETKDDPPEVRLQKKAAIFMILQKNFVEYADKLSQEIRKKTVDIRSMNGHLRVNDVAVPLDALKESEKYCSVYNEKIVKLKSAAFQIKEKQEERCRKYAELRVIDVPTAEEEIDKTLSELKCLYSILSSGHSNGHKLPFSIEGDIESLASEESRSDKASVTGSQAISSMKSEQESASQTVTSAIEDVSDNISETQHVNNGLRSLLECQPCNICFSKKKNFKKHMISVHNSY